MSMASLPACLPHARKLLNNVQAGRPRTASHTDAPGMLCRPEEHPERVAVQQQLAALQQRHLVLEQQKVALMKGANCRAYQGFITHLGREWMQHCVHCGIGSRPCMQQGSAAPDT